MPTPNDNIRLTMMRSIVMEPLASFIASQADAPHQLFDVIIWLNESFHGGVSAAAEKVFEKTNPFDPASTNSRHLRLSILIAEGMSIGGERL